MINRQCTLLSDSLAKAIERVCKQKDYENRKKRKATKAGKQRAKYSKKVRRKMRGK